VMLEEERTNLEPEDIARLGLSLREAEILVWLTLGKTDAEIGTILGISSRTVSHTLERVYRKLGVSSRAAAVATALRAAHERGQPE
jgi:DNA-binding CsgD family transcriptional regulator